MSCADGEASESTPGSATLAGNLDAPSASEHDGEE